MHKGCAIALVILNLTRTRYRYSLQP